MRRFPPGGTPSFWSGERRLKALEIARKDGGLGNSLNARVELYAPPDLEATLAPYEGELSTLFIVSQTGLVSQKGKEEKPL